jgi:hypothetical protein
LQFQKADMKLFATPPLDLFADVPVVRAVASEEVLGIAPTEKKPAPEVKGDRKAVEDMLLKLSRCVAFAGCPSCLPRLL